MEGRFEDLSIYAYKYIQDLAKNYKITNFKKKFFFNKELAYINNTVNITSQRHNLVKKFTLFSVTTPSPVPLPQVTDIVLSPVIINDANRESSGAFQLEVIETHNKSSPLTLTTSVLIAVGNI